MNETLNITKTDLSVMNIDDHVRIHPPDPEAAEAIRERYRISYAMVMWKLQELCGLTYKEARAHLMRYWEPEEKFAADLNISIASVRKLQSRAAWKVRSSGFDIRQMAGKYDAIFDWRTIEPPDIPFDYAEMTEEEKVAIQRMVEETRAKMDQEAGTTIR